MIARVVIDIKHRDINQTYDYFIKDDQVDTIKKGMRVVVSFTVNNIQRQAVIVDILEESPYAEKYIEEVLDIEPVLDEEVFLFLKYLTKNPTSLLAKAVETVVPNDLIANYQKKVILLNDNLPSDLKSKFNKKKEWILKTSDKKYFTKIKDLEKQGILKLVTILKPKFAKKTIEYITIKETNYVGTPRQQECLNIVRNFEEITKRYLNLLSTPGIVNTLIKKGVLAVVEKDVKIDTSIEVLPAKTHELFEENTKSYEKITKKMDSFHTYLFNDDESLSQNLLIKLIEKTVLDDKQVLILVPERFLVAKYEDIYQKLFPSQLITTLDSTATAKDRYLNKIAILDKTSKITIGSRSAVFSKFNDLGLLVVLQSHDQAYVQDEGIYYDALEVAKIKAKYNQCNLILQSHTMTLDQAKQIKDKEIKEIDFKLNKDEHVIVDIVDMKDELMRGNTKMISKSLSQYMNHVIKDNKKTLLIMNQKGYAPFVMCRSCSYVPKDKETDIPLNYSEKENLLRSNLTKHTEEFSKTCPICKKDTMKPVGSGIEQLENYLLKIIDKKHVLRIDRDTLSNKELYEIAETLADDEDIKIIIGTQMALKDVLANKVSLVGILMADQFLRLPKYDALEQAYILINNAKHIAQHRLVIQTYDPNNFVLNAIKGVNDFYKVELENRKMSDLPPFTNIMQIAIESTSYLKTYQYAFLIKNELIAEGCKVLGPTQANMLKQDKKYRFLLLMKYKELNQNINKLLVSQKEYSLFTNPEVIWY